MVYFIIRKLYAILLIINKYASKIPIAIKPYLIYYISIFSKLIVLISFQVNSQYGNHNRPCRN